MPAPFKMKHLAEIAASLRRRKLAVSGVVALMAVLLLGPLVLKPAALQIGTSPLATNRPASTWRDPGWAGGLEPPQADGRLTLSGQTAKPLTSASYTSGFDKRAAGLDPLPPARAAVGLLPPPDPRACPDDLNCSFRTAKPGALAPPPPPPPPPPAITTAALESAKPPPRAGFSLPVLPAYLRLPSPHLSLPSPNSLLKPFAFVGNTVVGLVKKL